LAQCNRRKDEKTLQGRKTTKSDLQRKQFKRTKKKKGGSKPALLTYCSGGNAVCGQARHNNTKKKVQTGKKNLCQEKESRCVEKKDNDHANFGGGTGVN